MRSTTRARLNLCRNVAGLKPIEDGYACPTACVAWNSLTAARNQQKVFTELTRTAYSMTVPEAILRAEGYRPPEPDADPESAATPRGPRPLPPSTAERMLSLTHLKDGRAILEVGDTRIDFSEREIEVLSWMLAPKASRPVNDWRT